MILHLVPQRGDDLLRRKRDTACRAALALAKTRLGAGRSDCRHLGGLMPDRVHSLRHRVAAKLAGLGADAALCAGGRLSDHTVVPAVRAGLELLALDLVADRAGARTLARDVAALTRLLPLRPLVTGRGHLHDLAAYRLAARALHILPVSGLRAGRLRCLNQLELVAKRLDGLRVSTLPAYGADI